MPVVKETTSYQKKKKCELRALHVTRDTASKTGVCVIREFTKPRHQVQRPLKSIFDNFKSLTLFITVKTIADVNPERGKFEIKS